MIGKTFMQADRESTFDSVFKKMISECVIETLRKISSDIFFFEKGYAVFKNHFCLPDVPEIKNSELTTKKEAEFAVIHFYQFFSPYNVAKKMLTSLQKEHVHQRFLTSGISSDIFLTKDGEITLRGIVLMLYEMGYINECENL